MDHKASAVFAVAFTLLVAAAVFAATSPDLPVMLTEDVVAIIAGQRWLIGVLSGVVISLFAIGVAIGKKVMRHVSEEIMGGIAGVRTQLEMQSADNLRAHKDIYARLGKHDRDISYLRAKAGLPPGNGDPS